MTDKRSNALCARLAAPIAACLIALTGWVGSALGGPVNPQLQSGSFTIRELLGPNGRVYWQITAADGTIVNYDQFDILTNEDVYFLLPSATSRMLNRINGDLDGTQIDGSLNSNGILYFVNQAGIFFGPNSVVNVGGIYAAAGSMTDADFLGLNGPEYMNRFTLTGPVENSGLISANGGMVSLLGETARNYGTIDVGDGVITMVSGAGAIISPRDPNGHVMVQVTPRAGAPDPVEAGPGVYNTGRLGARQGQIVLGAGDIFALAIQNDGIIDGGGGLVQMQALDGDIVAGGSINTGAGAVEIATDLGGVDLRAGISTGSLHVTGDLIMLSAPEYSATEMTFDGPVLLGSDVTLTFDVEAARTSGALGVVTFTSTVDSAAGAGHDLLIDHDTGFFRGDVGAGGELGTLSVSGLSEVDASLMNVGAINLGDLLLFEDLVINAGSDSLVFGRIDSEDFEFNSLTINAFSSEFAGQVGNLTPNSILGSLVVNSHSVINTDVINAQNMLTFNGDVIVDRVTTLTGAFGVAFNGRLDSRDFEFNSLTINSLSTTFRGDVGVANSNSLFSTITTDTAGTTTIDAGEMTAFNLHFNDDVVIARDTTLTGAFSALFAGRVGSEADEFNDLTVISNDTYFGGRVGGDGSAPISGGGGGSVMLGALNTDFIGTTTINTDSIRAQSAIFDDDVIIDTDTSVYGSSMVAFNGLVDSQFDEYNDLSVFSPTTVFGDDIGTGGGDGPGVAGGDGGGVTHLGTLYTDQAGEGDVTTFAIGSIFDPVTRDLVVNANQMVFDDDVVIDGFSPGSTLTLNARARLDGPEGEGDGAPRLVHFNGRVDSQTGELNNLVVNSPDTYFGGQVGNRPTDDIDTRGTGFGSSALGLLQTDSEGTTVIDTDVVNGTDLDFNDAVLVETSTTLTGAGSVDFASTVDSQDFEFNNLTVNARDTAFHGRVGDRSNLSQFGTITTDRVGTTMIDTDKVVALFALDINDNVVLGQDTWMTGGFSVDFDGRIDSEAGETNNLLVTSQDTRFGGQIGNAASDTRLGALETDLSGTTTIDTDVINVETAKFNDDVLLASDTVIDGQQTTFSRALDDVDAGAHSMRITGDATFTGEVGGTTKLGGLTVEGATNIGGGLVNADFQEYMGAVVLDGDTLVSGDDQLIFRGTVDGAGALMAVGAGDALFEGDITLGSFETALEGTLVFDTASITATGDVIFNDAVVLLDVPSVATIGSNGDLMIQAANFTMGQNQKLSVVGDLVIDVAGGTATLGDLGALGFIEVNADRIELLLRAARRVEKPDGTFITDFGLDIVAGGTIDFSVRPTSLNRDRAPRIHFSTPRGEGDISGNLRDFIMHAGGTVSAGDLVAADGRFLDLYAKGPTNSDVAESIAALAKVETGIVLPEPAPGPTTRQRLQSDLSIPARVLSEGELVTLLAGRAFYNDAPNSTVEPALRSSRVVVNRLSISKALEALQTYDQILQGRPPSDVKATLSEAWSAYVDASGEDADPAGFAAFCMEQGDEETLTTLRLIKQLRLNIERMGMTPPEAAPSIASLADRLMPDDMTPQVFNRIISGVQ